MLILFAGIAVGVSFLCSLLEAAFLSVGLPALMAKKQKGSKGAGLLLDLKQNRVDDAISSILMLNTMANTWGTAMAGVQAATLWPDHRAFFAFTLTILILILAEIVPKTLGNSYAVSMGPFVGHCLNFLVILMRPALYATRWLTQIISRSEQKPVSRREVSAYITMATREGTIKGHEERVMANLMRFEEIRLCDVMTPRTVVEMVQESTTVDEFLQNRRAAVFSRIPLYRENFDDVTGYVYVRDILLDVAQGGDRTRPIQRYARKIWFLPELAPMGKALQQFVERREHVSIMLDEHGGVSGLVTFEDIIETVLGVEIVDEADRVPDLRRVAAGLRDRRQETMQRRRQFKPDGQLESESSDRKETDG